MSRNLLHDLQSLGYLASTTRLKAIGHGRRRIEHALESGTILRVSGLDRHAPGDDDCCDRPLQRGKLTGPTALASYGVWDAVDRRIHVQLRHNRSRTTITPLTPVAVFTQERYLRTGVTRHWRPGHQPLVGG